VCFTLLQGARTRATKQSKANINRDCGACPERRILFIPRDDGKCVFRNSKKLTLTKRFLPKFSNKLINFSQRLIFLKEAFYE